MRTYRAIVQSIANKSALAIPQVFERRTIDPRELKRLNQLLFAGLSPQFVAAYREGQHLAVAFKKRANLDTVTTTPPSGVIVNGLIDLAKHEADTEINYMVARVTIQVQRMQHLGMSHNRMGEVLQTGLADRAWNAFINRVRKIIDNAIHTTADIGMYDGIR